ncbi:hypothetical protein A3I27_01125 [Candidatus Giovannonibacteria bacterium RIFCSPLOWO2_02_FULL_43_11b]|uniref:Large ribosomal subunit protein bL25 n=1 Tax=Candidatus Giovannonibacteria bacterium RIFCSPHIGHO2_12_FULL_43_15 TaxID=1798341 RepID=A0A1F5WRP6_9BACT|nr:MAG: hypothetical protein A2739_00280 [Candidatus Giovannonibacteria bacterium RIFCSPHIGHO2_01_FULL_43_100]OGF67469.1 MAG: hypothetical protein A3B97_01730 [Candidatus Giovannonibacteria bacterium RIFCSPHIGHO2_02_FULL_43_32]OGF78345.1 MAG: hypothetical protein A3F23_01285 [Candidatus Giovannonibacteria bacterium RIFCSPHIGHO2_12_FULL_43_15]OGF78965.1 MAG: hypothetical protein A3A15_01790 [Candidatus Giovannonibacteria bacterium RIFCSPLOWO2_01_FULL_43_60]OGF90633.1 MAG: hypothetical protein A3
MTSIKAEKREIVGKKVKKLRVGGKIPAVMYGAGEKGLLLEISGHDFEKVFKQAGESSLVELEIGPERKNVLIHDVAYDPIKDVPVHVDFLQVRMDKLIKAKVELLFEGDSQAIKQGGILVKVHHELEIEALPVDLPHQIKIDLSKLKNFEDKFTVSDLDFPKGVKTHAAGEEVLALIKSPRTEEELKAEEVAAAPGIESIEVLTKKEKPIEEGEAKDGAGKEKE